MNYRSFNDMNQLIRNSFRIVLPEKTDLIVGIPRSGLIPAVLISEYMNIPMISLDVLTQNPNVVINTSVRIGNKASTFSDYKHIVFIDDSCSTGTTLSKIKQDINDTLTLPDDVLFGCIYSTINSSEIVDFYFEIVDTPRMFEWNIMNHYMLEVCLLDMDGVICIDPTEEQNDDGEKYIDFIKNATPLFIPKYTIGAIVTSRLEKYRALTEEWLKNQGVKYHNLVMLNLPDKESRIALGAHAPFKANIYAKSNAELFIESNPSQASQINELTCRPVFCVSNSTLYESDNSFEQYEAEKNRADLLSDGIDGVLGGLRNIQKIGRNIPSNDSQELFNAFKESLLSIRNELASFCTDANLLQKYDQISEPVCLTDFDSSFLYIDVDDIECLKEQILHLYVTSYSSKVTDNAWKSEKLREYQLLTNELSDPVIFSHYSEEIQYIARNQSFMLYPYKFTEKYQDKDHFVFTDEKSKLKYVIHNEKKLFFTSENEETVQHEYNQLIMEQDDSCTHAYFSDECSFPEDGIFIDVGGAEGIISLDVVERAKEIYILECDNSWIQALKMTFSEYMDKVHIIPKYAGCLTYHDTIALDELLKEYSNENIFIKMDVEGMELEVLKGARKTLRNNRCKLSCAAYHTNNAEDQLKAYFDEMNYISEASDSWMLFIYGKMTLQNGKYSPMEKPYFRRGLVRAWKK